MTLLQVYIKYILIHDWKSNLYILHKLSSTPNVAVNSCIYRATTTDRVNVAILVFI